MARSPFCSGQTTGTGTKNDQIKVIVLVSGRLGDARIKADVQFIDGLKPFALQALCTCSRTL